MPHMHMWRSRGGSRMHPCDKGRATGRVRLQSLIQVTRVRSNYFKHTMAISMIDVTTGQTPDTCHNTAEEPAAGTVVERLAVAARFRGVHARSEGHARSSSTRWFHCSCPQVGPRWPATSAVAACHRIDGQTPHVFAAFVRDSAVLPYLFAAGAPHSMHQSALSCTV